MKVEKIKKANDERSLSLNLKKREREIARLSNRIKSNETERRQEKHAYFLLILFLLYSFLLLLLPCSSFVRSFVRFSRSAAVVAVVPNVNVDADDDNVVGAKLECTIQKLNFVL